MGLSREEEEGGGHSIVFIFLAPSNDPKTPLYKVSALWNHLGI
jgi:hypothetical protein